jgi:hypothetical protein
MKYPKVTSVLTFSIVFGLFANAPAMAQSMLNRKHVQHEQTRMNPGVVEPLVSWTKSSIHVCWRDGADTDPTYIQNDFKSHQKLAVQAIIQQEYTIDRVGIEFVGWENCKDLPQGGYDFEIIQDKILSDTNPMVKPFRDASVEGMAFMGEGGGCYRMTRFDPFRGAEEVTVGYYKRNATTNKKVYLLLVDWGGEGNSDYTPVQRLQNTALHEFGHVAGMRHEHIRPEASEDANCKHMGVNFHVTEKPYDTTKMLGMYDPNSIMNYCWLATMEANSLVMTELPNMSDHSLYEKVNRVEISKKTVYVGKKPNQKKKMITVKTPVTEYRFRVGLSQSDVAALQDLYLKRN